MPNPTPFRNTDHYPVHEIQPILACIEEHSAAGDFIFRGEGKEYPAVETGIRRRYKRFMKTFNLSADDLQSLLVSSVEPYTNHAASKAILSELQHYGGTTNLLDFSEDYRIALFFACSSNPDETGRLILLRRDRWPTLPPASLTNRAIAQKSIFVQPPEGYVVPDHAVRIEARAKGAMLEHLKRTSGVTAKSVYNDIHGYILQQKEAENAVLPILDEVLEPLGRIMNVIKGLQLDTVKGLQPELSDEEREALSGDCASVAEAFASLTQYRGLHHLVETNLALSRDEAPLALHHAELAAEYDTSPPLTEMHMYVVQAAIGDVGGAARLLELVDEDAMDPTSLVLQKAIGDIVRLLAYLLAQEADRGEAEEAT